ncbi:MAG TPA: hypothetical protein VF316_04945, partial [Polyangiaceae bacterium]
KIGFSVKSVFSDAWFRFLSTGTLDLDIDEDHIPFRTSEATIDSIQFIRLQKTIDLTSPTLTTITPAPVESGPFVLDEHPTELKAQATHTWTYTAHALGPWTVSATVGDFTVDDDLFVIVAYTVPAVP